ncbi:MAG: response regulator [Proteobacteria bacterium]|nr:response regulator [Pseudomonadota bacterium]
MKIRTLTGATVGLAAALGFILACLAAYGVAGRLVRAVLTLEHERHAAALSAVAGVSREAGESKALAEYVRTLPGSVPMLEYAYVTDAGGKLIAHSDPRRVGKAAEDRERTNRAAERCLIVSGGGAQGGKACVGVREETGGALLRSLLRLVLPALLFAGGLGVLLSLGVGASLASSISAPLSRLADAAREVGAGNLEVRLENTSGGEIGRLAEDFNDMVDRLRALDAEKEALVAGVSHDLRSPLAAIKMGLDYVVNVDPERKAVLPKHRRLLINLMENATRLGVFVTNVLDAAKMNAGKMEYHSAPFDLQPLARSLRELYKVVAESREIGLAWDIPETLPPVTADPERLERVLVNLLSNAVKYTESGGSITVSAREDDGEVELSVRDTGVGIAKEDLENLFLPYHQARTAEQKAKRVQGTGLGLYIVKDAMEAMGGSLEVESEPGKGTTVRIRLAASAPSKVRAAGPAAAPRSSAKVLVVDDDPSFAETIVHLLEAKGYRAAVAASAREAPAVLARERPDVVLLDMNLRDAAGAAALGRLRESPEGKAVPVLLCSATAELPEIERALAAGAACFLLKPLKAEELDLRIREALAR